MDEVVTTDSEAITVTRSDPYTEVGASGLKTSCDSCSTTVDRVEAVGVHIVGQTRGAPDTRDDSCLLGRDTHLGHRLLESSQDTMVTTARTPAYVLVALEALSV